MREIKLSLEMATKWYNGQDTELKALALQTYPELEFKQLPKTWEELGNIDGYYVKGMSSTIGKYHARTESFDRNVFVTKEQAEASIAMAQLSQLMAVYNDGWVADWNDGSSKTCICKFGNDFTLETRSYFSPFLNFKDRKTAELFLENFKDLIQTAKPLL